MILELEFARLIESIYVRGLSLRREILGRFRLLTSHPGFRIGLSEAGLVWLASWPAVFGLACDYRRLTYELVPLIVVYCIVPCVGAL